MKENNIYPVVILGAGPLGLAMAARLLHKKIPFIVIEKGNTIAANMLDWGHVQLFSSWEESTDSFSIDLIKQFNPHYQLPKGFPTGKTFVNNYLKHLYNIIPQKQVVLNAPVDSIQYDKSEKVFTSHYQQEGNSNSIRSRTVIDATGTWATPRQLFPSQADYSDIVFSGIPTIDFVNAIKKESKVVVVGSGHSAMNSLLDLTKNPSLSVHWFIRASEAKFGKSKVGGKSEQLENQLQALIRSNKISCTSNFSIKSGHRDGATVTLIAQDDRVITGINYVVSNIGAKPNHGLIKNFDLTLNDQYQCPHLLADKINPSLHSCDSLSYQFPDTLSTNIGYYLIGSKSFGQASNFLLATGYAILNDLEADVRKKVNS